MKITPDEWWYPMNPKGADMPGATFRAYRSRVAHCDDSQIGRLESERGKVAVEVEAYSERREDD